MQVRVGEGVRRTLVVVIALAIVTVLGAVVWTRGWAWTVAAWFGASAATFAVLTARAGRAAHTGERSERRLLERDSSSEPSEVDAGAAERRRG